MPRTLLPLGLTGSALALVLAFAGVGCRGTSRSERSDRSPSPSVKKPSAPLVLKELPKESEPRPEVTTANPPDEGIALAESRFRLGELTDLGPAAPARAAPEGVFLATKTDALVLLHLRGSKFESIDAQAELFSRYGRAPSLSKSHAYWVSPRGALLRGDRRTLATEELVLGAHSGTRTAVVNLDGIDLVAFIKDEPDSESPRAYLYAGSDQIARLSEDASTATSVALTLIGKEAHLFALEGRIGLSSLHHRRIKVSRGKLEISPDEVTSVLPGSHALTEIGSIGVNPKDPFAFLAMSQDTTHFGLAELSLTDQGSVSGTPKWHLYKNGIDPAPVAADVVCGEPRIAYARPSTEKPRSPQELRLTVHGASDAEGDLIATSRAFNDISIAGRPGGAVLVWTADRRTWAITLDCPR